MKPYRPGKCAQCGQVKRLRTWLLIVGRRQGRLCDECAAMLGGGDDREGMVVGPEGPVVVTRAEKQGSAPLAAEQPRRVRQKRLRGTKPVGRTVVVRGGGAIADPAAK